MAKLLQVTTHRRRALTHPAERTRHLLFLLRREMRRPLKPLQLEERFRPPKGKPHLWKPLEHSRMKTLLDSSKPSQRFPAAFRKSIEPSRNVPKGPKKLFFLFPISHGCCLLSLAARADLVPANTARTRLLWSRAAKPGTNARLQCTVPAVCCLQCTHSRHKWDLCFVCRSTSTRKRSAEVRPSWFMPFGGKEREVDHTIASNLCWVAVVVAF